jgi:hypothetical protein
VTGTTPGVLHDLRLKLLGQPDLRRGPTAINRADLGTATGEDPTVEGIAGMVAQIFRIPSLAESLQFPRSYSTQGPRWLRTT